MKVISNSLNTDEKDDLLIAKIKDAVKLTDKTGSKNFVGFLDERQTFIAQEFISKLPHNCNIAFWGGYDNSKRNILGVFPDYKEAQFQDFPLSAITFKFRNEDVLSHRDFLGSIIACGIKRESLGDILVESGRAVAFIKSELAEFICLEILKVGKIGVRATIGADKPFPEGEKFKELSGFISSPRLDAVVAVLTNSSRAKSCELIKSKLVTMQYLENTNISVEVKENFKISIRGYGKFLIEQIGPLTKKGRLHLKAKKYI